MPKLTDGRELKPDFTKITAREYRDLLNTESTIDNEDTLIAKVYGITKEKFLDMNWVDYKAIKNEFIITAGDPSKDDSNPN